MENPKPVDISESIKQFIGKAFSNNLSVSRTVIDLRKILISEHNIVLDIYHLKILVEIEFEKHEMQLSEKQRWESFGKKYGWIK